ncbi:hypothetical protein MTBBW1_2180019 [Desulfamplus magnetovallimortis]|uniref:Uncharacterized protein n=1 Tax=Desulfamplus magnetovallimortis TaxID=1246637 RepID=A0A1W1HCP1_9BACT|nr:hypothetical protein MTBBW1_2180019 [Desulfamplus magnetovallimortis]
MRKDAHSPSFLLMVCKTFEVDSSIARFLINCIFLNQDKQNLQVNAVRHDFYPVNPGYPGYPDSDTIKKAQVTPGVKFEY